MAECLKNTKAIVQQLNENTCPAIGYQTATVCVPVSVTPFANPLTPTTYCCGEPIVTSGTTCTGTVNGSCTFTMTQRLCIAVPVEFGAETTVGAPSVACGDATSTDVCTNCSE